MCGHFSFYLKFDLAHVLPLRFLTSLWVWVVLKHDLPSLPTSSNQCGSWSRPGAWALTGENTIQRKYLASSRIMQPKDASNVTLHVLDILLMPIDETVRTYSHLLLTHWSRPTARLPPAEIIASPGPRIYMNLHYIDLYCFHLPTCPALSPWYTIRTWLCRSSVNQSNLAKLAIAACQVSHHFAESCQSLSATFQNVLV